MATDPRPHLNVRGRQQPGRRTMRSQRIVLALECVFAAAMLTVALQSARTLHAARSGADAVDAEHLLTIGVTLDPATSLKTARQARERFEAVLRRGGVVTAMGTGPRPCRELNYLEQVRLDGQRMLPITAAQYVDGAFFQTVGLDVSGDVTVFDEPAVSGAPWPVYVNGAFATEVAPGVSAIGRVLDVVDGQSPRRLVIRGIVSDVRWERPKEAPIPTIYLPLYALPLGEGARAWFVARVAGNAADAVPTVRAEAGLAAPIGAAVDVEPVTAQLEDALGEVRLVGVVLVCLLLLAVPLAVVGAYSVVRCAVAREAAEIATKHALGASRTRLLWEAAAPVIGAVAFGSAAGAAGGVLLVAEAGTLLPLAGVAVAGVAGGLGLILLAVLPACAPVAMVLRAMPASLRA
jgi:hypothetical protein